MDPPITFAHRGARAELPENTIPAFRRALEAGVAGLESDAWLAGDDEVVLVHDGTVRLGAFGKVRVDRVPAQRLATQGVPRLSELYAELGGDYELSLDLKAPGVGTDVVAVARAHGDPARLWLCSPALTELEALRTDAPDVRLVHSQRRRRLEDSLERHAARLAERGIDVMNMHHTEWTAGSSALPPLRRAGVRVGHPGGAPPSCDARHGHRRGLLRLPRPHGCHDRRVEPVARAGPAT